MANEINEILESHGYKTGYELYREMFDNAPCMLALVSPTNAFKIIDCNKVMVERLGYSKEEILNFPSVMSLYGHESYDKIKENMESLNKCSRITHHNLWMRKKSGERMPVNLSVTPKTDEKGGLIYAFSAWQDITATIDARQIADGVSRKLAVAINSLNVKNKALLKKNEDLMFLNSLISHDLKAPLRVIANYAHILDEETEQLLPEPTHQYITNIISCTQKMEKLLENLIAYFNIDIGQDSPEEEVNVRDLITDVVSMITVPDDFKIVLAKSLPVIKTQRAPLAQVFQNLLTNAINHHTNDVKGEILVSAAKDEVGYTFSIKDNGPGINSQDYERIFEPTYKSVSCPYSSGVGLCLVKKLVESRGGDIHLTSKPGKGTTFHFVWPVEDAGDPDHGKSLQPYINRELS